MPPSIQGREHTLRAAIQRSAVSRGWSGIGARRSPRNAARREAPDDGGLGSVEDTQAFLTQRR